MRLDSSRRRRHGVHLVECAFIYPVVFFVIMAIFVGGMGIFRYQEVASLAREGARWASVRGGQYAQDTGNVAATATDVFNSVIKPGAISMSTDSSDLSYTVTWDDNGKMPQYYDYTANQWKLNKVHVTITYKWMPELYLVGPINLTSNSTIAVAY